MLRLGVGTVPSFYLFHGDDFSLFRAPCMCMWLPSFFFLLSSDFRKYREIRPKNKKRRDDTRRLKVPLAAERPGTSLRGGATSLPTTTTRRRTDLSTSGIGAELRETLILPSAGLRASPGPCQSAGGKCSGPRAGARPPAPSPTDHRHPRDPHHRAPARSTVCAHCASVCFLAAAHLCV